MNKLLLVLGMSILVFGCANEESQPSDQKVEAEVMQAVRYVNGNLLVSNELPEIEMQAHKELKYVGKFDFEIIADSEEYPAEYMGKPVAAGERYVFAAANEEGGIKALFMVQFEGFFEDNDFTYNYSFDEAENIGENKYLNNTWFYNSKQLAAENPRSEGARTRTLLAKNGYLVEDYFMMSRFVGLASEDRKNEIIIYYIEMLQSATGFTLEKFEQILSEDEINEVENALIERSRSSFRIIKG